MLALAQAIAQADPFNTLMVGWLLGGLAVLSTDFQLTRPRVANALDALYRRLWRVPACGPDGCYCRRTCLWMLVIDPARVRRG